MMNNDDNWSDAECRYFIKLCTDEKKKGNKTKTGLNPTGKDSIIRKFEDRFGKRFVWDKFKNKYDVCRRAYQKFKNLIHNRTGVGYDAMGRIDMSDDWWNERFKEWPGARKYKNKLIPNMDVFEDEFGAIHVSGAEGWSAQQGENSLDSRVGVENEDEVDSLDVVAPTPVVGTQNRASSSGLKRKRKEVDTTSTTDTRNVILNRKNDLVAQMLEREDRFSVMRVLEILNELPEVRLWSPFHSASVIHLQADVTHRQAFIAFPNAKDKISYLELRTGVKFVRGGPPTNTRELFNRKHSGLRSIIERTFGVWKAKWRILDRKHPKYGLAKWMKIVTATMALHNFIRESNREDYDFVHWQRTEDYHIHGDEDEDDEDDDDDDDDDDDRGGHIPYEPTGDRAMEGLRETITSGIGRGSRLPY